MSKLKETLLMVACGLAANWVMVCGGIVLLLLVCWLIGYFAQAFYGMKFDLSSVWVGVGVFTATGMLGFGKELAVKAKELLVYAIDSKYNSELGKPVQKGAEFTGEGEYDG